MPGPHKWTVEVRDGVIEALSEGNSRNTASLMAGIDPATLSRWITRGVDAPRGSQYREFAERVGMAEAAARGRALRILNRAMVDQPKWAAWFLERRDPAFAPPAARAERAAATVDIRLTLDDGVGAPALPTSTIELGEQNSPTTAA